jgi:hypothetical protein
MSPNPAKILSASRRTDIPGFYMDWFMERIRLGFFEVKNSYNRMVKTVEASKESVHSIVFWSKNYDAFLRMKAGEKLNQLGFNLYFNFTINSESPLLEPGILPLRHRLGQLKTLASLFGPENIAWRFDPICFYKMEPDGCEKDNLSDFAVISGEASALGIKKCVTSFLDMYPKIHNRLAFLSRKKEACPIFTAPSPEKKLEVIQRMEKHLSKLNMRLSLCCEKELVSRLGSDTTILGNACVDGNLLKMNFKGDPETRRDYGQRSKQGCKCTRSVDIGSYDQHPCFHNCLFCYAAPDIDNRLKKDKIS